MGSYSKEKISCSTFEQEGCCANIQPEEFPPLLAVWILSDIQLTPSTADCICRNGRTGFTCKLLELYMREYEFQICHLPGEKNVVADYLWRIVLVKGPIIEGDDIDISKFL